MAESDAVKIMRDRLRIDTYLRQRVRAFASDTKWSYRDYINEIIDRYSVTSSEYSEMIKRNRCGLQLRGS